MKVGNEVGTIVRTYVEWSKLVYFSDTFVNKVTFSEIVLVYDALKYADILTYRSMTMLIVEFIAVVFISIISVLSDWFCR